MYTKINCLILSLFAVSTICATPLKAQDSLLDELIKSPKYIQLEKERQERKATNRDGERLPPIFFSQGEEAQFLALLKPYDKRYKLLQHNLDVLTHGAQHRLNIVEKELAPVFSLKKETDKNKGKAKKNDPNRETIYRVYLFITHPRDRLLARSRLIPEISRNLPPELKAVQELPLKIKELPELIASTYILEDGSIQTTLSLPGDSILVISAENIAMLNPLYKLISLMPLDKLIKRLEAETADRSNN